MIIKKTCSIITLYCLLYSFCIGIGFFSVSCSNNSKIESPDLTLYSKDTLAVRAILDSNLLFTTSVKQVTYSTNDRVDSLNLNTKNIFFLPIQCTEITALRSCNLRNNSVRSIVSLQKLSNLQVLFLDSNDINCIPITISTLQRLQILSLNHNSLTEISESIGYLKGLQVLDLSYNEISSLPESIVQLSSLKTCDLGYNRLSNLSATIKKWADTVDPDWETTQTTFIESH